MWWWCAGLHCSRTGTCHPSLWPRQLLRNFQIAPGPAAASCGQRCARASEAAVLRAALGLMSATHGDCPAE